MQSIHVICLLSLRIVPFFSFQALCGSQVSVPLLGGERLALNLQDEVIKPSTVKRVVGKGLPNPKDPARRGDLIVNFDIVFPERLSTATRDLFRSHLPGKWNDHHYKLRNLSTLCYLKTNILVLQTLKKSRFYLSVLNYFILSCLGLTFFSIFWVRRHEFRAGIIVVGDVWLQMGVILQGLLNPKDPARLSTATRDLFRSHLPGKWNDHHYKLGNLSSTLCYLKTNILVLQTLKKSPFYLSVLNHFYSFLSYPTFFSIFWVGLRFSSRAISRTEA